MYIQRMLGIMDSILLSQIVYYYYDYIPRQMEKNKQIPHSLNTHRHSTLRIPYLQPHEISVILSPQAQFTFRYDVVQCSMFMFTFMVFLFHMGRMQGIWPVITCIVENIFNTCIWRNVIAEVTTIELSTIFSLSKAVFSSISHSFPFELTKCDGKYRIIATNSRRKTP